MKKDCRRRYKGKIGKLLLVNLGVTIALVLAVEMVVRITMPEITSINEDRQLYLTNKYSDSYGLRPNSSGYSFGVKISTDGDGFRIVAPASSAPPEKTILLLGDSVSLGVGVPGEQTFCGLLAARLPEYRIINSAVTGYTTKDYYNVAQALLSRQKFSGIIVGLCLNDFVGISQQKMVSNLQQQQNQANDRAKRYPNAVIRFLRYVNDEYFAFNNILRGYSRTYLLLKYFAADFPKNWFRADAALYRAPGIEQLVSQQLTRLYRLARRHNCWMLIVVFPYEYQLRRDDSQLRFPQQLLQQISQQQRLPLISLYSDFARAMRQQELQSRQLFLFNDPMHFSAAGHRLAADAIHQLLQRRQLLAVPDKR